MSKLIKGLLFGSIGVASLILADKVVQYFKGADTAGKLTYDIKPGKINEVKYTAGVIPESVTHTIDLQVKNPTNNELKVNNLSLTVSIPNGKGGYVQIASISEPAEVAMKANKISLMSPQIELPFAAIIPLIPEFATYIVGRLRGDKATQKILINGTVDSMGLTVPLNKVILI